jgi:hypothetical protein
MHFNAAGFAALLSSCRAPSCQPASGVGLRLCSSSASNNLKFNSVGDVDFMQLRLSLASSLTRKRARRFQVVKRYPCLRHVTYKREVG